LANPCVFDSRAPAPPAPTEEALAGTDRRRALARRIRLLVAVTISYNLAEAIVAISAGTVA
jgi:ABC-type microcin C transport system permease subunit YejE